MRQASDAPEVAALAESFRLLGDPGRLRIVLTCLDAPASVGAIVARVGLSQSLVSHHLRLLRASRLLRAEKDGRQVFYSLPECHVREMLANIIAHVREPRGSESHAGEPQAGARDGEEAGPAVAAPR